MISYVPGAIRRCAAVLSLVAAVFLGSVDAQAAENVKLQFKSMTLNANLVLAEGKSLKDGAILLTHGTLAHNGMEVIKAMQALLAERGHSVLAINLGLALNDRTGMYDCATPHRHLHTDALDEIGLWLKWLKGKGADKIILMGHSRGGNQTAWFAAERPDPAIKKVVLLAPQVWSRSTDETGYKKRYGAALGPVLKKAQALVGAGQGKVMMDKTGFIYCKDTSATAEAFVSYYQPDPRLHTPNLLGKIKVPVLVVAGSEDKVVKGVIKAVKPLADGARIQLKVVEEAGHYFRDFAAEDAADAIDEFLQ